MESAGVNRRRGLLVLCAVFIASVFAGAPTSAAFAHGGAADTALRHMEEDFVIHSPAKERRLERRTHTATARDAQAAAAAVPGDAGQVGQWGPVVDWPVVAEHTALLANGKVLAYDSVGDRAADTYPVHDHTRATVWDPATGTQTPVNVEGYNLFCSGLAHLMSGSIFVAGGNKNAQLEGIVQTHVFDPDGNEWSRGPDMAEGRWYPSVTPLDNGEMLITEGGPDMPEVLKIDGGLRALDTASLDLPLYPWLDVAPDGRAFYSGPDQTMRSLDTAGGGSWQTYGQRDRLWRGYGSHALYDVGKILVAGGASSSTDARIIDLNGPTPQPSATRPMAYGRRQHNLTVLADGKVLATGGNSSGAKFVDLDHSVYPAELWDPATGRWTTLAAMQVTRQYHSTALLLPDGRVLSAGGGICTICDSVGYLAKNAEVFSPPYLFKKDGSSELAPRPEITSGPDEMTYDASYSVSTPDPASIRKVALVRLGAVTHSVNMEQRYVPLDFTVDGGEISAAAPPNANIAPPGIYMLFLINADGVPSVAKMARVSNEPTTTITSGPTNGTNDPTPTFTFSSEPGTSFECKVDSGSYQPCDSAEATPHLTDGTHSFSARATDAAGNTDPTPASRTFTVRTGSVSVVDSALVVTAAQGAKDNLEITRVSASVLRVTDSPSGGYAGSGVHGGPGCTRSGDYTAFCTVHGISLVNVSAGGENDRVVNANAVRSQLDGGAGSDLLAGGQSNDTLIGRTGADVMKGRNGSDKLYARDLSPDTMLDCDGGTSRGPADTVDLDLLPMDPDSTVANCEIKTRH
ncbi:MAG TPA: galactose oxidase-like domain-containing protein [Solirubrobacterales bacterium]|nr:galactose oxidase-like domain-containing protein [Solirubrobacterales bacterium]